MVGSDRAVVTADAPAPCGARTLWDVLVDTAKRHPDAVAVSTPTASLTYRRLIARADAVATELHAIGVGPGERVGICVSSGTTDLYVAIAGTLAAGAAYVPVDAADPVDRRTTVFDEAGVAAWIGDGCTAMPLRWSPEPVSPRRADAADDAWVIFTSGSTGTPKGVAVTHANAAAFVAAERRLFLTDAPVGPGDRVAAGLSVGFDASCEEIWLAWASGATLVPAPRSVVTAALDYGPWLRHNGISVVSTVPTLASLWTPSDLAHVRLVVLGGEACPRPVVRLLREAGVEAWNTYGPTETTVVATAALLTDPDDIRIGHPLPGWSCTVVDEAGDPVGWGETGELVIGGAGVARYLDPVIDAQRFAPHAALGPSRAYRTGDIVQALPDGLVFVGRKDSQVKIGGRRVELGEIDAAVTAVDGVAAAATVVRQAGTAVLVTYITLAAGCDDVTPQIVHDTVAATLPAALVPQIAIVDEFPTRPSGKVDTGRLPWPLTGTDDAWTPDGFEATVADVWTQTLGAAPAGPDVDFFDAGGTSIGAARMVAALRETAPTLSVNDLLTHRTPARLAQRIAREPAGARETSDDVVLPPGNQTVRHLVQFTMQLLTLSITGVRWVAGVGLLSAVFSGDYAGWVWVLCIAVIVMWLPPVRVVAAAAGVRAIRGRMRPGVYRIGGPEHLRHWTAHRWMTICGVPSFGGGPWMVAFARLLGNRCGSDILMWGLPPLTGLGTVGDRATIEPEADISGVSLQRTAFIVGTVTVGADTRLGLRSTVPPGATVADGIRIPAGWTAGRDDTAAHADDPHQWPAEATTGSRWWRLAHNVAQSAPLLVAVIAALPTVAIMVALDNADISDATEVPAIATAGVLGFGLYVVTTALAVRLASRAVREGTFPVFSGAGVAALTVARLVYRARRSIFLLYAGMVTPWWMRLLGASVGRDVELSTLVALPTMLRVEDRAFVADDAAIGMPQIHRGWMHVRRTVIGEKSFVGNSAIVEPGRHVPAGSLIGVLSVAPHGLQEGATWLGRPARQLPRTPDVGDEATTYRPTTALKVKRAVCETGRLLSVVVSVLLATAVYAVFNELDVDYGMLYTVLLAGPLLFVGAVLALLIAAGMKWLCVGRVDARNHPLWSSFVWRNELADTFTEMIAVPWLLSMASGTVVMNWWLRALGARVGAGVWCETHWLPEPDLISISRHAAIDRGVVVQTHLFQDRILRLNTVVIGEGSTIGAHSVVLPDVVVGDGVHVEVASVVLSGDRLPTRSRWAGNPVRADEPAPLP